MPPSADETIQQAGARLAEAPVPVPELGRVARGRRRTRLLVTGAVLTCLIAGGVSAWPEDGAVRVDMRVADEGPEPTEGRSPDGRQSAGAPVLNGQLGIWPGGDRRFGSAEEMVRAFASEVLGWDELQVTVQPPEPVTHPVGVTFSRPGGAEMRATAAPIRGKWLLMMIGSGLTLGYGDDVPMGGPDVRVKVPPGPKGTTTLRWWALVDGEQVTGVTPAADGRFVFQARPEAVQTLMVIHLDDSGSALGVVAALF